VLFAGVKSVVVVIVLIAVVRLYTSGYGAQNFWELVALSGLVAAHRFAPARARRAGRRR
jgi:hypothetical protein